MAELLSKILIWTKIVLLSLVTLYALAFLLMNSQPVQIWWCPFRDKYPVNLVPLIFCTMLFTVIFLLLIWAGWRTIHQLRALKQRSLATKTSQAPAEPGDANAKASPDNPAAGTSAGPT